MERGNSLSPSTSLFGCFVRSKRPVPDPFAGAGTSVCKAQASKGRWQRSRRSLSGFGALRRYAFRLLL